MDKGLSALRAALGDRVREGERLAPHTTLRIGGPADLFAEAKTIQDLIDFATACREYQVPFFVLGKGSNILVLDGGIRGLVVENHCESFELHVTNTEQAILNVESGASLPGTANRLARQGWSGLEWAIGVPATVGGAVVGNAGAHGGAIGDNVRSVTALDANGTVLRLHKTECEFEYRSSRFKRGGEIVLSAEIELRRDDPNLCIARMSSYTDYRRRTQPTEPSVGSMFKNPPGDYAGRLVEAAGLKGTQVGQVEISRLHANFFVNRGDASSHDVLDLVGMVQQAVLDKFGVSLELEIQIVGEE